LEQDARELADAEPSGLSFLDGISSGFDEFGASAAKSSRSSSKQGRDRPLGPSAPDAARHLWEWYMADVMPAVAHAAGLCAPEPTASLEEHSDHYAAIAADIEAQRRTGAAPKCSKPWRSVARKGGPSGVAARRTPSTPPAGTRPAPASLGKGQVGVQLAIDFAAERKRRTGFPDALPKPPETVEFRYAKAHAEDFDAGEEEVAWIIARGRSGSRPSAPSATSSSPNAGAGARSRRTAPGSSK